jgi:hypothetical protein
VTAAPPRTTIAASHMRSRARFTSASPLDAALLVLVVTICAAVEWAFASRSWFFADDFILFHQVQLEGVHPGFLFERAIVHFAPGHRLFEIIVQRFAPLDFNVALGILLAFHCASIVLVQRTLTAIFGRRWWTFVVALTFGLSYVYLPGLEWYSAGLLVIPSVTFSLACIHAYVRWWHSRRRAWLVWSVVALCLGLGFYEKTALVPLYLFAMTGLLLEPGRTIRSALRSVRPQVWALYLAPVIVLAVIYLAGNYAEGTNTLDLSQLPTYLRIAWLDGFAPIILGVRVPASAAAPAQTIAVVVAQLAIVATVIASIRRRRPAWRAWAFLAGAFLVNALLIVPRLGPWGPQIGYEPRYYTELAMLLALVAPFAFAVPLPRQGERPSPGTARRLQWPRPAAAALAAGLLAGYVALVVWSDVDITRHAPGRSVRAWAQRLDADLARVRAHGETPNLIDEAVPSRVIPGYLAGRDEPPSNLLSSVLALSSNRVRFNEVSNPTYRASPSGHLEQVRLVPVMGGNLAALRQGARVELTGGQWISSGGASCVQAGPVFASLLIVPHPALRGHHFTLRADYRTSAGAVVLMNIDNGVGFPPKHSPALAPAPAAARRFVQLGALPTGVPTFAGLRFLIPRDARVCFTALTFGWLRAI